MALFFPTLIPFAYSLFLLCISILEPHPKCAKLSILGYDAIFQNERMEFYMLFFTVLLMSKQNNKQKDNKPELGIDCSTHKSALCEISLTSS